jgi:ABC-type transport system involved in cytochrome bd biosynthesis fused ATPase/permease subunit
MMFRITHGSLSQFFDKVPIARVLNRFSNDISKLDDSLMGSINAFLVQFSMIIFSLIIDSRNISPLILGAFLSFFVFGLFIQNIFIRISKDLERLQNITQSPVINRIKDIAKGRVLFNTFKKTESIMKTLYKDIDENTKNQITKNALTSWFVSALVTVNVLVIQGSIFVLCVVFLK